MNDIFENKKLIITLVALLMIMLNVTLFLQTNLIKDIDDTNSIYIDK